MSLKLRAVASWMSNRYRRYTHDDVPGTPDSRVSERMRAVPRAVPRPLAEGTVPALPPEMKSSGVGREGGLEALRFFTEPKNVFVKY